MQTVLEKEVEGKEEKEKGGADWRRRAMEGRGRRETGDQRRGCRRRSREKGKEGDGRKKTKCTPEKEADGMRGKEP